ncbi:DUF58 domain-containing protein [candidate division WOR-3 bacterium]|nr:DUF58 domain-containing protein [candidate division WOR-3 bacterium]
MPPAEILKKVRKIEIKTKGAVESLLGGDYKSSFKGRGIEFHEVRNYVVGDDVRTIDWNVTARMNHPYVKRFVEERELNIILLLDLSRSTLFGSTGKKRDVLAEIGALLTFSAIENNDRVGLLLFTDRVENYIPPQKGRRHGLRILRDTLYFEQKGSETDPVPALEYLLHILKRRAIVFILSDFLGDNFTIEHIKRPLSVLSKKHDLISIVVRDPMEEKFPIRGLINIEDFEKGEKGAIFGKEIDRFLRKDQKKKDDALNNFFKKYGIDSVFLRTGEDYSVTLHRFFRERARRLVL